jgi:3-phenylpropionate/trans-cinnamate dioxygenase ferredoxin reductase subunit
MAPMVVVGAGLAGLRVVERLRRSGYDGELVLVGAEAQLPYDRPPMSKTLLTQDDDPTPVHLRKPEAYDELGLDLRLGVRAKSLDVSGRTVRLDDGSELTYDKLVIATGLRARRIPGLEGQANVVVLRTFEDCLALRATLRNAEHVTVVGGGVLGCEVAASARKLGVAVDLVEGLELPLVRVLGTELGGVIADLHRENAVRLHLGTTVSTVTAEGERTNVELGDGTTLQTDLVVVAVGAVPNTEWLDGSGLDITDGVLVDRTGQAADHVYAVGDVARMPHPLGEGTVRLEHWTSANDTAVLVAGNLLAEEPKEHKEVAYFWSDQYTAKLQCLGVPDPDDDLTVVDGSLEEGVFLAIYARSGTVTGAVAIGRPAALMKCRNAVGQGVALAELVGQAPWVRRSPVATGGVA